ncbi:MAG: fibronectin type III domain-containing protein, partial [bacterium]
GQASAYPVDNLAPAAPAGLGVADVASDQGTALNLTWTANGESDRKDYGVYSATYTGYPIIPVRRVGFVTAPGTTHQDDGLTAGTTYYYRLTARDVSLNESGGTAEVSTSPVDNLAPAAPTGLGLAAISVGGGIDLSWTVNGESDLKDYGVYKATNTGGLGAKALLTRIGQPGTTHQETGLTNSTTYYYQVTARDVSLNESGGSTEMSGLPQDTVAPAVPVGLGVVDVASDQGVALQLSWTANTEVDRKDYGVYRATFTGLLGTKTMQTRVVSPGTTHQDGSLTNGTTYYYQLTARDFSLNESTGSAEASAIPVDNLAPAAPTGLGLADVPSDQGTALNLAWTPNGESDRKDYGV